MVEFFFILFTSRFHFIEVLEVTILGIVKVFRQRQVSVTTMFLLERFRCTKKNFRSFAFLQKFYKGPYDLLWKRFLFTSCKFKQNSGSSWKTSQIITNTLRFSLLNRFCKHSFSNLSFMSLAKNNSSVLRTFSLKLHSHSKKSKVKRNWMLAKTRLNVGQF